MMEMQRFMVRACSSATRRALCVSAVGHEMVSHLTQAMDFLRCLLQRGELLENRFNAHNGGKLYSMEHRAVKRSSFASRSKQSATWPFLKVTIRR